MIPPWVQTTLWVMLLSSIAFVMIKRTLLFFRALKRDSNSATAWETIRAEFKHVGVVDGQRIYEIDGKQFTEAQLKATFNNWFEKDNGDKDE